jgi:hypothetical protein
LPSIDAAQVEGAIRTPNAPAVPDASAASVDVDAGELGLRGKAGGADRSVGHRTAIAVPRIEEGYRRAGEVEIVHRVAERRVEAGERLQQTVAAAGNVVKVDQVDAKACADAAQKIAPRLGWQAAEIVRPRGIAGALLELPFVADGDQQIMAKRLA